MDQSPKRLTRSTTNRMIGGVCGGLAEYFDIDPTIIRIIFVAVTLWGGSGVAIYLLLWLFIPAAGSADQPLEQRVRQVGQEMRATAQGATDGMRTGTSARMSPRLILGSILVIVGASAILRQVLPWRIFGWEYLWPMLIVLLGFTILIRRP